MLSACNQRECSCLFFHTVRCRLVRSCSTLYRPELAYRVVRACARFFEGYVGPVLSSFFSLRNSVITSASAPGLSIARKSRLPPYSTSSCCAERAAVGSPNDIIHLAHNTALQLTKRPILNRPKRPRTVPIAMRAESEHFGSKALFGPIPPTRRSGPFAAISAIVDDRSFGELHS